MAACTRFCRRPTIASDLNGRARIPEKVAAPGRPGGERKCGRERETRWFRDVEGPDHRHAVVAAVAGGRLSIHVPERVLVKGQGRAAANPQFRRQEAVQVDNGTGPDVPDGRVFGPPCAAWDKLADGARLRAPEGDAGGQRRGRGE